MAGETQLAGTGWGGEFWVHNGTALTELKQVVSFTLPQDEAEEVDISHLKSAGRRREYAPGMIDGGEFEVVLNYRANSDTDILLRAFNASAATRTFKAVIPERGVAVWDITGSIIMRSYDRGEVNAEDAMQATCVFRISGAVTEAVHT